MSKYVWIVDGNILCLISREGKYIPTAEEIFSAVVESGGRIGNFNVDFSTIPEGINFSELPVDVGLKLQASQTVEKVEFSIAAFADINGMQINLPFPFFTSDHIIVENTWYPFVLGEIDLVMDVLSQNEIENPRNISFKKYLALRTFAKNCPFVTDETDDVDFTHLDLGEPESNGLIGLNANLYPYQTDGWKWLRFIFKGGAGGILADEMGLGKTLQVIALLVSEARNEILPSLIVTPSSLLENWRREIKKFAPSLTILVHQGPERTGIPKELEKFDLIIVSYDTVVRDLSLFRQIEWKVVTLDEAQAIKNPSTSRSKNIKLLPREVGFAVTGTPVENRLRDLWSIIDFVYPGYLGGLEAFVSRFEVDENGASELEPIVSPLILRRLVGDVAKDLPPRIDVPVAMMLSDGELESYEELRQRTFQEYETNASLVAISKLRMFCTHPFLHTKELGDPYRASKKYQRLVEILDEIFSNSSKALIFTSFNEMSDILVRDLSHRFGVYMEAINGRTDIPDRQPIIDEFSCVEGGAALVLNPKAAGTGLNITAANHVIHYNLEWNPATEDQASARAHRRGQDRPVTIHRLFYTSTVEEVIDDRLTRKRGLASAAVVGVEGKQEEYGDIIKALRISPV